MDNGQRFRALVEELIQKDSKYKNELNNFIAYLEDRLLLDKAFDLTISDIDEYFIYSSDSKIGALPTLVTHISALKALFEYLIEQKLNFRDLLAHISTNHFKENLSKLVDESFKKGVIPSALLNSILYKMDMYIEENIYKEFKGPTDKKRFYEVMIASLYARLSLIIPIKVNEMIKLKLGNIKDSNTRHIKYNGISVKISNGLKKQIINTIKYAEKTYEKYYNEDDAIFEYLYNAVNQKASTTTVGNSFIKTYKEIDAQEMLKQRLVGKKYQYIYPAESYKTTAILELLNSGVNIVYLKKLTGLEMEALLSNYDFNKPTENVNIESININNSIINTNYYSYL